MLGIGMHTRSSRRHYRNDAFPDLTFCGFRLRRKTRVTSKWKEVDCGNCIAQYATAPTGLVSFLSDHERGPIWKDNGEGGTVTYWEQADMLGYALDRSGQRLPAPAVPWDNFRTVLDVALVPASLEEIRLKWIDARLSDGDL